MATFQHPGVYIDELPGDQQIIVQTPTGVAAFVGRTQRGPVDAPVQVESFSDYERQFGALDSDSAVSYAVRAFFDNGGSRAIVVRVYEPKQSAAGSAASGAPVIPPGCASLALDVAGGDAAKLTLVAANPGAWGDRLAVQIDHDGILPGVKLADGTDAPASDLFNLWVSLGSGPTAPTERFSSVTLREDGGSIRLDRVLEQQSFYLRVANNAAGAPVLPAGRLRGTAPVNLSGGVESAPLSLKAYLGDTRPGTGLAALEDCRDFDILVIPPDTRLSGGAEFGDTPPLVYQSAAALCARRKAMLIVDPPVKWRDAAKAGKVGDISLDDLGSFGVEEARNAVVYFPRVVAPDPNRGGRDTVFPPGGAIAGIWAATDNAQGVWKAPAGMEAAINAVSGPELKLTDAENGQLNPLGINCLREFAVGGTVVWGARTMRGGDQFGSEWKYVPVRRTALLIEKSLQDGLQWVVFEPNNETLWAKLRQTVGAFMHGLFQEGAFGGVSAAEAFFVKCDSSTTTQADLDQGVVNVQVGFAPVQPAEFIVLMFSQKTLSSPD